MLTKIAEQRSREEILPIVSVVMSGLLKAFNSPESSVRKAAVFCMVALHMCTGEAVEPYLNELNGSKTKLLNVYINRAQTQQTSNSQASSSPGSPKSTALAKPR